MTPFSQSELLKNDVLAALPNFSTRLSAEFFLLRFLFSLFYQTETSSVFTLSIDVMR